MEATKWGQIEMCSLHLLGTFSWNWVSNIGMEPILVTFKELRLNLGSRVSNIGDILTARLQIWEFGIRISGRRCCWCSGGCLRVGDE